MSTPPTKKEKPNTMLTYLGAELISAKVSLINPEHSNLLPDHVYMFNDSHCSYISDDLNSLLSQAAGKNEKAIDLEPQYYLHHAYVEKEKKWINIIGPSFKPSPGKPTEPCTSFDKTPKAHCDGAGGCAEYLSYSRKGNQVFLKTYTEKIGKKNKEYIVFPLMFHPNNSKTLKTMAKYYLKKGDEKMLNEHLIGLFLNRIKLGITNEFSVENFYIIPKEIQVKNVKDQ